MEGATFDITESNLNNFKNWWIRVNAEHLIIFWLTGAATILILSLLAYSTVFGLSGLQTGINFLIEEGRIISTIIPALGTGLLLVSAIMLFGTQFSVFASTGRIMSENLVLSNSNRFKASSISKYFYFFLWLQILIGSLIFLIGFTEPLTMVIIGAVLNAITMFIYSGMLFILNTSILASEVRPSLFRKLMLITAFLFYGGFSILTLIQNI